uniref:chromogranin-A isoform X2 n=1 Tax=Doryrhamphus excisus TaxID=161450 RepID=UPI0025ADA950|nr:chromogranin-A isoform X2 [Doryrhamphus excisus]
MIALLTVTLLMKCVLSLPVTPSVLENDDDAKVMKCVVEALADVLARPRPLPVSHQCLHTLRTDQRLLSLLRHFDFLKELQDIATHGGKERARPHGGAMVPHHVTQAPLSVEGDVPDRSMLVALGGPGERSILSQKSRTASEEEEEEEEEARMENKASGPEETAAKDFHADGEEEDKRDTVSQHSKEDESDEEEEEEENGMKRSTKQHHFKEEEMKTKRNRTPEEKELQMIAGKGPEEEGSAGRKTEDADVGSLSAIESELEDVAQKLHELRRG